MEFGAAWDSGNWMIFNLLPLQVLPGPPQEPGPQTSWDVAFVTSYVCRELERPSWKKLQEMSCP